jgi:hypothetical protein
MHLGAIAISLVSLLVNAEISQGDNEFNALARNHDDSFTLEPPYVGKSMINA